MGNILVTGCAGFIGSHVVDALLVRGHSVVGLDLLTYAGSIDNLENSIEEIEFYCGDICHSNFVDEIIKRHKIECIMNFAAETHVDNSIDDAAPFMRTNIEGVMSLLEICRKNNTMLFHVSTDEVYGSTQEGSFLENDRLNPRNPYSASKAAAEHLVTSYNNTFGVRYKMVRMSNNFGPRQNSEKFIPTILRNLAAGNRIPLYGDGKNVRDWLYVKDCAKILCDILEDGNDNDVYNVSFNNEHENIYVINMILKIMKLKFDDHVEFVSDRLGHDFRYSIDSNKMRNIVKTKPSSFKDALIETMEFYCEK